MTNKEKTVILHSVLTTFVVKEMSFTSNEIANHAKRLGIWIRNRDVAAYLRENIHKVGDTYGCIYRITVIDVDHTTAALYHPSHVCHTAYLARDIKAITPDEFEAMHGVPAFENDTAVKPKPEYEVKSGKLEFNFPTSK